ncbi:hypothetical protein DR64_8458 [Paraburkholderia xenovorans LB400]|nr:hypothetical protein DR64_8458 [Paraburkholderia xenovorans LB400]
MKTDVFKPERGSRFLRQVPGGALVESIPARMPMRSIVAPSTSDILAPTWMLGFGYSTRRADCPRR